MYRENQPMVGQLAGGLFLSSHAGPVHHWSLLRDSSHRSDWLVISRPATRLENKRCCFVDLDLERFVALGTSRHPADHPPVRRRLRRILAAVGKWECLAHRLWK